MTLAARDPDGVRSFPPPAPDAVSSRGPSSWAPPFPPPSVAATIEPPPDVAEREVPQREVGDEFELIWPTGEVDDHLIDDHLIDGPLAEDRPQGVLPSDTPPPSETSPSSETSPPGETSPPSDAARSAVAITVLLPPVAPPTEGAEPSSTAPVADDVVLAVRRAIAALESESAGAEEPAPSEPTDERRSALKRLIGGLRRH